MNLEKVNPDQKFGYKVNLSSYCESSHQSDEQYGDWSSSYSNSFNNIEKTEKYADILSIHDIKPGEDCFVVWAEYSTGDSFGSSYCGSTESIGVFKDYSVAQELVEKLKNPKSEKAWNDTYSFDFTTSDGQRFAYGFVPWSGYFETLENIHIEKTWVR